VQLNQTPFRDFMSGRRPTIRNLRDIFGLQTEVATAVTQALQVMLLEDTSALVETRRNT